MAWVNPEITLGKLISDLQAVQKEHGSDPRVCFDGYQDYALVVRTTRKGRNRAESSHDKIRVILDIKQ